MRRRQPWLLFGPTAIAGAAATDWAAKPELLPLDSLAGCALLGLGTVAWARRSDSRTGALMAAAGIAWFAGSFGGWPLHLHRAVLAQLLITYPTGRLSSRVDRIAVALAYVYAVLPSAAGNDETTLVFALAIAVVGGRHVLAARHRRRRPQLVALGATLLFAAALALGSVERLTGVGSSRQVLAAYDLVVAAIALGLFAHLILGRHDSRTVTGVVVELGGSDSGGLAGLLARLVGDTTLELGFWMNDERRYANERGETVDIPDEESGRRVRLIGDGDDRRAIIVHDPAVLDDEELLDSAASAVGLAVSNIQLQSELRLRIEEVEASRRRLLEAAVSQRRRLERILHDGALRRLDHVAYLLDGEPGLRSDLDDARAELQTFAEGLHPTLLAERGLPAALADLAARAPVAVHVDASVDRLPGALESATYFICSEALANVSKHASATGATVRVHLDRTIVRIEVADDGRGGADPTRGSGLRGLADRAEALGGTIELDSDAGRGTRITARLPMP